MFHNKKSNLLLGIFFVLTLFTFLYFPGSRGESYAEKKAKCSLVYDIGCQYYYCWYGNFNNTDCGPCGSTGC